MLRILSSVLLALVCAVPPVYAQKGADVKPTVMGVGRWLERGHFSLAPLDKEMSQRFLRTYLDALDPNKLYFIQADIDEFTRKYAMHLDEAIFTGSVAPAVDIFGRFSRRVEDRVAKNKELLEKTYTFKSDRTLQLSRKNVSWFADDEAADKFWRDLVEADMLRETLSELKLRTPVETLSRRYDQILRNVKEMEDEDVVKGYLSALAHSYDAHSDYLSPSDLESFQINMRLSLEGIGAVLRSEDGYTKVIEISVGGPADRDGRLKVNDRIVAVAQGDGDMEDVVDMKVDKVVKKIRGKKGTVVRLLVLPAEASDPSMRKVIDIVRDQVQLKDQEAKAELFKMKGTDGEDTKIGWINLPMFYADMESRDAAHKSTTTDMKALIGALKRNGMQGLVVDLRRNGGGSLEEAINLSGLFIPQGPVVQTKNANGRINVSSSNDGKPFYDGPLVVLVSRMSASASEIFAGVLQDYGRAVVVGDERTFGKGTVQTVMDFNRRPMMQSFSLKPAEVGALKLTISKFYRVLGGSTQLKGVESNIVLPSLTDNPEIGESALKNVLPYDEVPAVRIPAVNKELHIGELKSRTQTRVATDPEFAYIKEDAKRLKEKIETNTVSLNIETRRAEIEADKQRKADRKAARVKRGEALDVQAFEITLDAANTGDEMEAVAYNRKSKQEKMREALAQEEEGEKPDPEDETAPVQPDPIRDEAVRIMADFIELTKQR